jgi:hypothetical protein
MHYCEGEVYSVTLAGSHVCDINNSSQHTCLLPFNQQNNSDENIDADGCCLSTDVYAQSIPETVISESTVSLIPSFTGMINTGIFSSFIHNYIVNSTRNLLHLKIPLPERSIFLFVQSFLL